MSEEIAIDDYEAMLAKAGEIARAYAAKGFGDEEELESVGNLAIAKAIDTYDAGERTFSTWLSYLIIEEIYRYRRSVKRRASDPPSIFTNAEMSIKNKLSKEPTPQQVAINTESKVEFWRRACEGMTPRESAIVQSVYRYGFTKVTTAWHFKMSAVAVGRLVDRVEPLMKSNLKKYKETP